MAKQHQNRPKSRAPHGHPKYTARFAFYCTEAMRKQIMRKGGSAYIRHLIAEERGIVRVVEQ